MMPTETPSSAAPGFAETVIAQVRPACTVLLVLAMITGLGYPLVMTAVVQAMFPWHAAGSPVRDDAGTVRGSHLIGQPFSGPQWFHGRPSATGTTPYDATASGGSNLGPRNPALAAAVSERVTAVMAANPGHSGPIPVDLVTASGSGLDPHVSPTAALLQVRRVAAARGVEENAVRRLVARHVEPAVFGIFGRPRVNVLDLNRALESMGRGGESPSR